MKVFIAVGLALVLVVGGASVLYSNLQKDNAPQGQLIIFDPSSGNSGADLGGDRLRAGKAFAGHCKKANADPAQDASAFAL